VVIKLWLLALVACLLSPALAAGEGAAQPGAAQPGAAQPESDEPADEAPELVRIEPGKSGIDLENVWIRAMPPFQPNSAGYMTIVNRRKSAIAVVGASSSVARKTELHTTRNVGGLMRMEKLNGLAVAPGERSELAPGGNHLMLFGLAFRPVPGDDITVCLELASREEICTRADVRKSGKGSSHQHH
jgi:copper(I)-binding protein